MFLLDEAGKTDLMRCVKNSLPYGIRNDIAFWSQLLNGALDGRTELLTSERYARLKQAAHLDNQYMDSTA